MRNRSALTVVMVAILAMLGLAAAATGQAREDSSVVTLPGPPPNFQVPMWKAPLALLYDNGPLVTNPGACTGPSDDSSLQTSLGLSTYGFGHAVSSGFRMADDFTVPALGWHINTITFFAYQTGSTTTSTINQVNVRIWNAVPPGGTVVFGDTTTNRMTTSAWSNDWRSLDTSTCGTTRPIMASVVTINQDFAEGTYWVDWQTGGTLTSGPWAPPVSIVGQTAKTGSNALQYDPAAATWNPAIDTGTALAQQDFPFIIDGTVLPVELQNLTVE